MQRKLLWTLIALLAVGLATSGIVDATAENYAEEAFRRALVTFAVARTLNGVISVVQGTELALEPGGVGVNIGVGQVLDPINDLVEQFSSVMLVATSSLGLQNVLLGMSQWWGLTAALTIAGLAVVVSLWWPRAAGRRYALAAIRALLFALALRFIAPALVIGTNLVAAHFLEPDQAAATAALEATSQRIEELNTDAEFNSAGPDPNMMDRIGNTLRETLRSMDIEGRLERLKATTANASEQIIDLIVLFALQTIILPVVFVWLVVELLKSAIARSASSNS